MLYDIIIEQDESGRYVGEIVGLPACYTQAKSIPELMERMLEVSQGAVSLLEESKKNKGQFKLSLHVDYATA